MSRKKKQSQSYYLAPAAPAHPFHLLLHNFYAALPAGYRREREEFVDYKMVCGGDPEAVICPKIKIQKSKEFHLF